MAGERCKVAHLHFLKWRDHDPLRLLIKEAEGARQVFGRCHDNVERDRLWQRVFEEQ
jgi:hypothetical protein